MRLRITRRTELAVRALQVLGDGCRHKAAELADEVESSAGFVTQVLQPLVALGWARSVPGPSGGFELAVGLASISVLEVIEALEGPTDDGRCVLESRPCRTADHCVLHEPWLRARRSLSESLDQVPLSTLPLGPSSGADFVPFPASKECDP